MPTPPWLHILRGLLLMGIGAAGVLREMFFTPQPSLPWVTLWLGCILGEGVISAWWLAGRSSGTAPPSASAGAAQAPSSPGSSAGP